MGKIKILLGEQQYERLFLTENIQDRKKLQLQIILATNPMLDNYHTGIRKIEDIKFLEEIDKDYYVTAPDWTEDDIADAIETKRVIVYSSYPIKNGVFVTPSRMEASTYAGGGKVYSKEVSIYDIAWIDSYEGQYAKI